MYGTQLMRFGWVELSLRHSFSSLHYEYMLNIVTPNTVLVQYIIIHIRIPNVRVLTPSQYLLEPKLLISSAHQTDFMCRCLCEAYSPAPLPTYTQVLLLFYRF
jgi:hypothetical protein